MADICGVYIIKSVESGRVYVGSSKRVKSRILQHAKLLDERKHHNDDMIDEWQKFGHDRFEFGLLEECKENELRSNEFLWCKHYDAFNPDRGFNRRNPVRIEDCEPPHFLISEKIASADVGCQHDILIFLALKMSNDNVVFISPEDRRIMSSACKKSINTINNSLSRMCRNGVIIRKESGKYIVNDTIIKWGKYKRSTSREIHIKLTGEKFVQSR